MVVFERGSDNDTCLAVDRSVIRLLPRWLVDDLLVSSPGCPLQPVAVIPSVLADLSEKQESVVVSIIHY